MKPQQLIWSVVRWFWSIRGLFFATYCLSVLLHVLFIGYLHHEHTLSGRPSLFSNYAVYPLGHELSRDDPYGFSIRGPIPHLIFGPLYTFPPCLLVLLPPYLISRRIGRRRARPAGVDGPGVPRAVGHSRGWWRRNRRLFVIALGVAVALCAAKVTYLHTSSYLRGSSSIYANYHWAPPDSDAYRNRRIDLNLAFTARSLALDVVLIYLPTLGLVAPFCGALGAAGRRGRPGAGDAQHPASDVP